MTDEEIGKKEFIEEQRAWLMVYREQTGLVWTDLSKRCNNIPSGTLSQFGSKRGYNGRELYIAEAVMRFREGLAARDTTFIDAPEEPPFFETQTSIEIFNLLHWCLRGNMVAGILGSGLGKSTACARFKEIYPNIFIVTLRRSQGSPGALQKAVLKALGVKNAGGTTDAMSDMICERLAATHKPVLIFDEAQHMTISSLEETRGWCDESGAGIAYFGDKRLYTSIYNSKGKEDIPQFRRRLKSMPVRLQPYKQDVLALANAWNVQDKRMIVELEKVAMKPGGLGLATEILKMAAMLAAAEQKIMDVSHLQEAIADDTRRNIAA